MPEATRRRFLQLGGALPLVALWRRPGAGRGAAGDIERIEVFALRYPMRGHFKFFTGPHGSQGRASVLVKVTTGEGRVGWGQSVPIARWSYETLESVEVVLREYFAPALLGLDPADLDAAHARMGAAVANGFSTGMPIARAGVDLALHDLAGKLAGRSLPALWDREPGGPLTLSWTVNPRRLDEVGELVAAGRARGYRHFNIKVGPDPDFDVELARAVRALAPRTFLWADANGGYEPDVALAAAPKLAEAGVDVLEAPCKPNRIAGYQALKRQGALPILMDEGVVSPVELREFLRLGMLDGVAMKPARCGGLLPARRQIEMLEEAGKMWLGSGLTDPDLSLAASLQLFGAYGLRRPAALNGPQFLAASLLAEPLEVADGALAVPDGPGLGVAVDEEKLLELVAATAATGRGTPPPSRRAPRLAWDLAAGRSLALQADGQDLWRLHHDRSRPHLYFHPLALPGSPPLTRDAPPDHPWHHGLWFSWKFINGVNYWENAPGSDRPAGRTRWLEPGIRLAEDHSAGVTVRLEYAPPDGDAVLEEERRLGISAPATDGSFSIRWEGRFTARAEHVVLDRTPLPGEAGGKVYGGYAGLSLRLADLGERRAATPDGPVVFNEQDRFRGRARAFEYDGLLAGRPAGIAILDDPRNPNAPSPWYAIRSRQMSFFTPAVICYGPLELRRGESFTLRYRVLVHPGRWEPSRLASELERR